MNKILIIATIVLLGVVTFAFAHSQLNQKEGANKETIGQQNDKNKTEKGVVIQMNKDLYLKDIADYRNTKEWKFKGNLPAVIDFYADWCGPCRQVAPLMKELAKEYEGKITIYKVNVDEEKELATAIGIESLPTILFIPMKGDPQVIIGSADKATFKKAIDQVLLAKPTL